MIHIVYSKGAFASLTAFIICEILFPRLHSQGLFMQCLSCMWALYVNECIILGAYVQSHPNYDYARIIYKPQCSNVCFFVFALIT